MASADQIRAQIEEGRAALRAALESADAARWEAAAGDEEWSARRAAEHAIGSERAIAGGVANAMMGKPPERPELALSSPAEALAALEAAVADCNKVIRYVEDRDLEKRVGESSTIQASMELLATHARDHAGQITAATS